MKLICHKINYSNRSTSLFGNLFIIIKLIFLIKKNKFTHILSFTIKPNIFLCTLKFFFNYKLIVTISGLGEIFINNSLKNRIIGFFFIKNLANADFIYCHNIHDLNFVVSKNVKIKNKIQVINGSGVNLNKFIFNKLKITNKIKFLLPGRIIKEKGILEFIEAADKVNKLYKMCEFKIIGEKYDKSDFNNIFNWHIAKSIVIHEDFNENIYKFLCDNTCIVLPSYREGLSKVLIESLAVGRPIITTNVPGCSQLVENNKNGFIVQPKNPDALYDAIIKFIKLSNIRKIEFSNYSSKLSKKFDENIINKNYLECINSI